MPTLTVNNTKVPTVSFTVYGPKGKTQVASTPNKPLREVLRLIGYNLDTDKTVTEWNLKNGDILQL